MIVHVVRFYALKNECLTIPACAICVSIRKPGHSSQKSSRETFGAFGFGTARIENSWGGGGHHVVT